MEPQRRQGSARRRGQTLPASRARIPPLEPETPRERLLVGAGGESFQHGQGNRVQLGRREPLKRMLLTLAELRLVAPGAPISHDHVFLSCWPGSLPSSEDVGRRVRGAVCALEVLGLDRAFVITPDAIYIDPHLPVVIEP